MRKKGLSTENELSPDLIASLQRHPELHERIERILRIVEDADGDATKADEAEERVAEELRKMGQEALQSWAERKLQKVEAEYEQSSLYKRREKKASTGQQDLDE
jgi:hypothetical protein